MTKKRPPFRNRAFMLFLLPSLLGMLAFYIVPYLASFYYTLTSAETGAFAGLDNFRDVLGSVSFRTAAANTAVFMAVCVPLNVVLPFILAHILHRRGKNNSVFVLIFMLPLVIPTGATVYFWHVIFNEYGFVNGIINSLGGEPIHWFQSELALWVVIIAFLCKNIGFNMVLFLTGLSYIPNERYEAAAVEGAGRLQTLKSVTLTYLMPTTFMVFLMSIINSFKIFREIFLLFGNYPYKSIYMLQHYMNNQFFSAGLQKLSVASVVISIAVAAVVSALFVGQKRLSDNL